MSLEIDYSIGRIERETGISKDVLRVWERRYGFPMPQRTDSGERFYLVEDLERLLLIKRLMDIGHRPGRLMKLTNDQFKAMLDTPKEPFERFEYSENIAYLLSCILNNQFDLLSEYLDYWLMRYGVESFVLRLLPELMKQIGNQWQAGSLSIYQEHFVSEMLQSKLRQPRAFLPTKEKAPIILLTTLPEEQHGLILLVCEILLKLEGIRPINAGIKMPVQAILQAVDANRIDAVCLSLSESTDIAFATRQINELLQQLPQSMPVLLGGEGSKKLPIRDERIRVLSDSQDLILVIKQHFNYVN